MSATVTTTKTINVGQLVAALNGAALSTATTGNTTTITAHDSTTQAALQAAVDAHVAVDEQGNRATLEQQATTALANNKTFVAITSPTNAQTLAQVKALSRQNNAVIRLLLNRLDATD